MDVLVAARAGHRKHRLQPPSTRDLFASELKFSHGHKAQRDWAALQPAAGLVGRGPQHGSPLDRRQQHLGAALSGHQLRVGGSQVLVRHRTATSNHA
jgi:hypothetical protein